MYLKKLENEQIDLGKVVKLTENYTPADIRGLVCNA